MKIKSPLNLPDTIITHLEQLADDAWRERTELGLSVPEHAPDIQIVIELNNHGHYSPDINLISLDLCDLRGKEYFMPERMKFRDFLSTSSLLGLPLVELINAFITQNPSDILEEMRERAGKKSRLYYGQPDGFGRCKLITAFQKVEEISPYILSDGHKRDLEKLLALISDSVSLVQGAGAFTIYDRHEGQKPHNAREIKPHLFTYLRHWLDHAAFYNSTLGLAAMALYKKMDSRTKSLDSVDPESLSKVMPEYQMEEFQMLTTIAEAGASFFNLVPYGRWEHKKSNVESFTSEAKRYILGAVTLNHLYINFKYFGLAIGFPEKKQVNIINAFVEAHIKDPSRLGQAYQEALTAQEFMSITKGTL